MPLLKPTRTIVGPRLGAPRWPFEVNWSSPITKDLVFLFVYPFGQPINLINGRGVEPTSSMSFMGSQFGPAALHTGRVQLPYSPLNPGDGPVTIMSAANPSSTVRESIICQRVANQTNQIELRAGADTIGNPSLTDMSFFVLDGSGGGATASGACDGEYHWFVGRRDGTDMSLFVDGAPQASSTVAVRSITDAGTFVLGGLPNTSTIHYNQNKIIDAGWHRALTDSEIWALYDPSTRWDLIHELGRRSYFFPAAPVGEASATATLDAAVQAARSAAAGLDAAVEAARTQAATLAAAIQARREVQATLSGAAQAERAVGATLTAAVLAERNATASLQAAVLKARLAQASLDTALQTTVTASATLDANVVGGAFQSIQTLLDAALLKADTVSATMDGAIRRGGLVVSAELSAAVADLKIAAATLDVAVSRARLLTTTVDAAVQAGRAASSTLDALIGGIAHIIATGAYALTEDLVTGTTLTEDLVTGYQITDTLH